MSIDFAVTERVAVASSKELLEAFAECSNPIRLAGFGSTQDRVPAPNEPVTLLELARLGRILRLEADDLTCSVEPGVRLADLDGALAEHDICLPCSEFGTSIGGVFARGERTALAPGGHNTRSLLLGLEGVLAEGLAFKTGARVVKSVAGFDLQKLFVGSRGRLFAATALHLKLRPRPQRVQWFSESGLERTRALSLFSTLRKLRSPAGAIILQRSAEGEFAVHGKLAGRAHVVDAQLRANELRACDAEPAWHIEPECQREVVNGFITSARLPAFLDALPDRAPCTVTGTGQIDALLKPNETDRLLLSAPELGATLELRSGTAERRGRSSPRDAVAEDLSNRLAEALDPKRILR